MMAKLRGKPGIYLMTNRSPSGGITIPLVIG